jgi:hypothetical protein
MLVIPRTFVLGMVVLLAATPAAADTVVTAKEVISCSVVSADTNFVRLKLPQGGIRMLNTRDVHEIRLSDSSRVAELAAHLPELAVTPDSAQPAPPPSVPAGSRPRYAGVVDTLAPNASPVQMVARCGEMEAVLRESGRSDRTVVGLLWEVQHEEEKLRRPWYWPEGNTCLYGLGFGGLPGALIGFAVGEASRPTGCYWFGDNAYPVIGGGPVGCLVGWAAGSVIGMAIGTPLQVKALAKHHRSCVNDLVRRVNRAIASPP